MKEVKKSTKKKTQDDVEFLDEEEVENLDLGEIEKEIEEDIYLETDGNKNRLLKNKKVIMIILISLGILVLLLILLYIFLPKIKLNGKSEIKISYNTTYNEKGAKAKYLGKDVSKSIKISGKVDTSKIGNYKITYTVKKGLFNVKKVRLVKVVDEKRPVITLEGEEEISICPNAKFEEIGFSSIDEYDGDLTDKVEVDYQDDKVTYTVKDSSNNAFSITRKLNREDTLGPEITLNGNSTVYVTLGNSYTDLSVTALDNCDGDLTEKVSVSGSVDTNTLGDYELTYKVVDSSGNETTATRKVVVQKEIVKRSASLGCGQAGVIYLTFDDGPNNSTTTTILDVLKRQDVKATFFVTNTNGGSDSQIKREYDEGHLVALHTSTHEYSQVYASYEAYFDDLNTISARVERITGKKSMFIRFPGGSSNTVSRHYTTGIMSRLASDVEAKGYSYFDWNVDSRDAEGKNCDEVYSNVVNGLSKSSGNVVLMHDIKTSTACAIERIIEYGKNNGYTFDVLNASVICHHKTAN